MSTVSSPLHEGSHAAICIAELSRRHESFHSSSKDDRISLAKSVLKALKSSNWDTAGDWVDECMRTQKLSPKDDVYGQLSAMEVLLLGSVTHNFLTTFIDSKSVSFLPKMTDSYTVYGPKPIGPSTSGTFEMHANQTEYESVDTTAYSECCQQGSVSLVLGAGNQTFLTMIDVLDRIFLHSECVLIKHHPLRPYLMKPFQKILRALIEDDVLRMVVDESNDVTAELIQHPSIQHVHLTGSTQTYNKVTELVKAATKSKTCGITAELGCATPWIVVPGPWSDNELENAAKLLVGSKKANGGCNCLSPQVVVVPPKRVFNTELFNTDYFCALIEKELRTQATVPCYYPGSTKRKQDFCAVYTESKTISSDKYTTNATSGDDISVIYLKSDDKNLYCIENEVFGSLLVIVEMESDIADLPSYLDDVVKFVNSKVYGTLSCTVLSSKDTDSRLIDKMVANLNYGMIAVNNWTGLGYTTAGLGGTWGPHPCDTGEQSGRGRVGNILELHGIIKTVLRSTLDKITIGTGKLPPKWLLRIIIVLSFKNTGFFDTLMKILGILMGF